MNRNFTGYLLFKKDIGFSSKYTKISAGGEIPAELNDPVFYLSDASSGYVKNLVKKIRGAFLLKGKGKNFQSTLFLSDPSEKPYIATGDIKGTDTLLLCFLLPGDQFEIFIAPGLKSERGVLLSSLKEGVYTEELEALRGMTEELLLKGNPDYREFSERKPEENPRKAEFSSKKTQVLNKKTQRKRQRQSS